MSCPGGVTDSHLLGTTLQWISVLSRVSHRLSSPGDYPAMDWCPVQGEAQTLISWGLPCNGLVFCPGGVTDSHLLETTLQWISVLSRGSHRLSSPGDYPVMDQCPVQGESQTLISWGLPCNGLVSCPGGVTDSHFLGTTLQWISVLSRRNHRLSQLNTIETRDKHLVWERIWLAPSHKLARYILQ